jgi:hypothetical protein
MRSFAEWLAGAPMRGCLATLVIAGVVAACSATASDDDGATTTSAGGSGAGGTSSNGGSGTGGDLVIGVGGSDTGGAAPCTQNIDIVFVMDVSTSMGPFLSKLAQEMPVVDAAVKAMNLESEPHYGLVVFVDDVLFANGGQPYTDVAALQADFQSWSSFTSSNSQVSGSGYNSTWPENSLDALHAAATQFPWRAEGETLRAIIHTTDDTFWQGPMVADGVQIVRDYPGTVSALQQAQVRVFAFASYLGGPSGNENVSAGWFAPYGAQPSIPDATGGAAFEIDLVLSGQLSLSASINEGVEDTLCEPYPVPQ